MPLSGHEDSLLWSALFYKKYPAFNHKLWDTEQRQNNLLSEKRDAAVNISVGSHMTLWGCCACAPVACHAVGAPGWLPFPRTCPQQDAGFLWHKCSMPPSYLLPGKVVFCFCVWGYGRPSTSWCACCLLSLPFSESPVIFLLISSLFLIDLQESSLNPSCNPLVKKERERILSDCSLFIVHGVLHWTEILPLYLARPTSVLSYHLCIVVSKGLSHSKATKVSSRCWLHSHLWPLNLRLCS